MWSFGTTMTLPKDRETASNTPSSPPPSEPSSPSPSPSSFPARQPHPPLTSPRALRQLSIFFAGAGFLSLAGLITRRAILRKNILTLPKFYTQSNHPSPKMQSDGSLIAFEALNLATLNVMGFGIMMTGGIMWAFDISDLEDLRALTRRHLRGGNGVMSAEEERQVEEWVRKFLLKEGDKEEGDKEEGKEVGVVAAVTSLTSRKGKDD